MTYYIRIEKTPGAIDLTSYFHQFTVEERMDLIRFRAEAKTDILNQISPGDKIILYLDSSSPPSQPRNIYVVDKIENIIGRNLRKRVRLEGREEFFTTALNKIVAELYQYRQAENIFKDLIAKYTSWTPIYDETDITLDNISFNYVPLYDALKTIMDLTATYLQPDTNNNINLRIKGSRDSGLVFTDTDFKPSVGFIQALEELKNIVYVVGSEDYFEDQIQTDVTGGTYQTNQYYLATSFTPDRGGLRQISLYLEKIGLPPDLTGKIVRDNNGEPTGEVLVYFTYNRNYLGAAGWYPTSASAQLIPGQKYWIVLDLTGDASNYYRWYYGVSGEYAYSTDGVNWTVGTGAGAYKTYYGVPVIVKVSDEDSVSLYGGREIVVRDESIKDRRTARTLATQILNERKNIRSDFGSIVVYSASVPRPGEMITINSTKFNVNNQYLVKAVRIELEGGVNKYVTVELDLGPEKAYLEQVLREFYSEIRKIKHKDIDVLRTELNKYVTVTDPVTQSDSITVKTKTSGTYIYDDADSKYGFADYG